MTVEVKVFEADNSTEVTNLTAARQVRELRGKDLLTGVGDGTLTVDFDHPGVAELTGGRIVQVHDNGRVPLAFSIDKKREVLVPSEPGDANRVVTVTGQTLRGRLEKARVLPWLPVETESNDGQRPISKRRLFNPASPTIDLTAWTTPFVQTRPEPYERPRGWPSPYAQWLWGLENTETTHPVGWNWFRRQFTIADDEVMVFLVTGDNTFVDYLEAVELQREEPEPPSEVYFDPYRSPVKLAAGTYQYTVAVRNDPPTAAYNPGGMIAEAWITGSDGLDTMVFMSGIADGGAFDSLYGTGSEAWKCLAYPIPGDPGYGHTVGTIVDTLLTEAQARGELTDLTWDFTGSLDSNGDAWSDIIAEVDFDAAGTVADAIEKLEEMGYCDVQMSYTGGLELCLFNGGARGSVQPITISVAEGNLLSHAVETDYVDTKNDVLLVHDLGFYLMDDDAAVALNGRQPGGQLPVGPVSDPALLEQIGAAYLNGYTEPVESVIVETTPMFDFAAEPGDSCTVEGDVLRITELGMQLDMKGALQAVPVFSTPFQEARKRSEKVVDRLLRENGKSTSASRVIDTGTKIPSGKLDSIKVTSWSWTLPEDLEMEFWDTDELEPVGWQPYPVEENLRITELRVECQWAEPDGLGGLSQVSEGQSRFSLMIDGAPAPVPLIATVDEIGGGDGYASGSQLVYGPALVTKGQTLSVAPIENGAHINGSVTIFATEPL